MDETRFRVTQTNLEIQLPDMMKSVYGQSAQTLRDCTRVCAHSRARACVCVCVCVWMAESDKTNWYDVRKSVHHHTIQIN